ncbi:branched chain amino acid ABC transporter substrate-binding protein [Virgisporangium aliadipatigenens]|uniref:Branched chain amino acid ABC transporter substrate-binding protein n=1 Tax=Virgisporangium aliadipatigenens TaxID=741659 RepID=A0A8J3YM28_9ACTN|nr:branched chain amino acid ABC transporter substrate-binding protein [Virgisporangium aliadipatigenens]
MDEKGFAVRQSLVRVFGGVAAAVLIAGSAAACKADSEDGGSAACGLKIGVFGALSGDNAGLFVPAKNGVDLAISQYNEKNKDCTVELTTFDSQGSPDKAGGLATSASQDTKIVAMIGPGFSGESEVANAIFDQAKLPAITPSATRPSLSTKGWKIFHRGVGNDLSQGPAAARYIKNVMKAEKVYVINDQTAYGAGLTDEAKKVFGAGMIAGEDKTSEKQTDFAGTVTKVKTSGAQVIFYGGYTAEASLFLKQLRAQGWTGTLVGGDGINDTNMLSVTGQKDVEGTIATCPCAPATNAKGTFVADYKKKFSVDPAVYADVAYDLANIFLEGIKDGKSTREDLNTFLGSYNKAGSASGVTYKWEASGELDPAQVVVWAYEAKGGAWVPKQEIPKS